MVRCGERSVWLDARHLGDEFLRARFPSIRRACAEAGYELSEDLVPVAPAAHYTIGGVTVDLDGRASLSGLFATGEAAASGLHGANRLASNSLLEGVVFSRRIARILECKGGRENLRITGAGARTGGHACGAADREELEMTMSRHAGAVRTGDGLERAAHSLAMLSPCIESASPDRDALESANMISVSLLMTHAAWLREESRGTHWRSDFPKRDDATWRQHVVWRRGAGWRLAPRRTADERVGM
jgi:L-aspartate oxidase